MRKLGPVLVVLVLLIGLGVGVAYNREPAGEAQPEFSMLPPELGTVPGKLTAAPKPERVPMGGSVRSATVPASAGVRAVLSARAAARTSVSPVLEDAFLEALDGGSPMQSVAEQAEQSAEMQFDGRSWRAYAPGFLLAGAGMALLHASESDIAPSGRQLAMFQTPMVSRGVALNANEAVRPAERGLGGGMVPVAAGASRGGSLPYPAVALGVGAAHGPPTFAPGRRLESSPGAAANDHSVGRADGGTRAARGDNGDNNGGTPSATGEGSSQPPVRNPGVPGGGVDVAEVPASLPEVAAATVTPEPVSIALLGTGLAGVATMRRRRKHDNA